MSCSPLVPVYLCLSHVSDPNSASPHPPDSNLTATALCFTPSSPSISCPAPKLSVQAAGDTPSCLETLVLPQGVRAHVCLCANVCVSLQCVRTWETAS